MSENYKKLAGVWFLSASCRHLASNSQSSSLRLPSPCAANSKALVGKIPREVQENDPEIIPKFDLASWGVKDTYCAA